MRAKKDIEGLIKDLKNKDRDVRAVTKALRGKQVEVRLYATSALGEIGDATSIKPLVKALEERTEAQEIRKEVAKALDRLGWKPIDEVEKTHYLIAKEKWNDLARMPHTKKSVDLLARYLYDDRNVQVPKKVTGVLGKIGDVRAIEPLIDRLSREPEGWQADW